MTTEMPPISQDPELALLTPFVKDEGNQAALALYALLTEIRHSVLSVNDESLARIKLAWWRDELGRMLVGQADHPSCVSLGRHAPLHRLDPDELMEPLEGLRLRLEAPLYNDQDELLLHAWRAEGALAVSAARLAGAQTERSRKLARDMGLSRALAQIVMGFEAEKRSGRCWIPADLCSQHGSRPESLIRDDMDPPVRVKILAAVADLAEQYYRRPAKLVRELPQEAATLQIPATLAALTMANLKRSRPHAFQVREAGPIARLFTTWRMARALGSRPPESRAATPD